MKTITKTISLTVTEPPPSMGLAACAPSTCATCVSSCAGSVCMQRIVPRGLKAMLPHGGIPEVISPYMIGLIAQTGGADGPIGKQFVAQIDKEKEHYVDGDVDPLAEDEHEVAPGVVYKYRGSFKKDGTVKTYGRVLWTVTRFCATYCRFCTRGREIGIPPNFKAQTCSALARSPFLSDEDIKKVFKFLRDHREINEVILSGGDPLTAPRPYLTKIMEGLVALQQTGDLDIIRLGTRLPIVNPSGVQDWHYELLAKVRHPYLMVHVNHPAELTPEATKVLDNFMKKSYAVVSSQSVFLKGVNDSEDTLFELFVKLTKNGIRPYYLFQNDPVYWAQHFTIPFKKALAIWGRLRPRLSGMAATARFVIDTPFGYGKIPVPESRAWKVDYSSFCDFKGKEHKT
ncbi:MAG: radical SAM protein [Candidatus Gracilibacteria bacterium]